MKRWGDLGRRDANSSMWRFWCYRCEQWCEAAGPWCELYAGESLYDECIFVENPGWILGVDRRRDPDVHRLDSVPLGPMESLDDAT